LERKIKDADSFEKYRYLVKMLKSKASYIQGKRSGGRVPTVFRDYIHTCIDQVNSKEEFDAFLKFFESTVGFYYGAGGERIT
jgi:CRISPR/Cas system CSM-associated protein Csm2 small subunit